MKMKVKEISGLFNILSKANLSKMDDADKYIVIKMLRKLRPVAEKYETDKKDAYERLRPDNWEEVSEASNKWREENGSRALTEGEVSYILRVNECLADEKEREENIDLPKLSEEAFQKLMAGNEWNNLLVMELSEMIVDETITE